MRKTVQIILVVWFILIGSLVLIPSVIELAAPSPAQLPPPKAPPEPPNEINEHSAAVYAQEVASYQGFLEAYKTYAEAAGKASFGATYEAVVTKTLFPLLERMLIAFLAYAFVVAAATAVENATRLRYGQQPVPFRLF